MSLKRHHRFMWDYSKSLLFQIVRRPAFVFLGITAWTIMTFFSVVIYFIEHPTNPHFNSYLNSAYFTVSTMTSVGFGDISPITPLGRVVAMIMMLLGTFIFVSFMGVVASTVLEVEIKIMSERKNEASKRE